MNAFYEHQIRLVRTLIAIIATITIASLVGIATVEIYIGHAKTGVVMFDVHLLAIPDTKINPNLAIQLNQISNNINSVIRENVKANFDATLSVFQLLLAGFGIALAFLTILAGFVYTSRVREAETLLQELRAKPGEFVAQFFTNQVGTAIQRLNSKDLYARSSAIKSLFANPSVTREHFDTILSALEREYSAPRSFNFQANVESLSELLLRVDPAAGEDAIAEIVKSYLAIRDKVSPLLPYIAYTKKLVHRETIKRIIEHEDDRLSRMMVSALEQTDNLDSEYITHIFSNCSDVVVYNLVNFVIVPNPHRTEEAPIIEGINGRNVSLTLLHQFIGSTWPREWLTVRAKVTMLDRYFATNRDPNFNGSIDAVVNTIRDTRATIDQRLRVMALINEHQPPREFIGAILMKMPPELQTELSAYMVANSR
jgi:hypothetical protein